MKNLGNHVKTAFFLTVIAFLLMGISLYFKNWTEVSGILQGLATGLLSGMVLLLITGIKGNEIRELSDVYNFLTKVNDTLIKTDDLYSTVYYYRTYHKENDSITFEKYECIISNIYMEHNSLQHELAAFNYLTSSSKYTLAGLPEFIELFDLELREIHPKIVMARIKEDKTILDEVSELLFILHREMNLLHQSIVAKIQEIHNKREGIKNSFL